MAFQPDDDRFYDAINGAGRDYQNIRGRVAEDQAASTRELGQAYGNMLPNTLHAGMQGADWAMKRGQTQQQMDFLDAQNKRLDANEGRLNTEESRKAEKYAEDQQAYKDQQAFDNAAAEESYARGAGVDYAPGITHKQVRQMAGGNEMGQDSRHQKQALDIANLQQEGENSRSGANIYAANQRQKDQLAFENLKLATETGVKNADMAKGKPAPPELISKLADADFSQKALQSLGEEWQAKAQGPYSSVKSFIPGTDASRYDDATKVSAQMIGKYLEEGKMSDADVPRYQAMLPTAYDTPERAQEKLTRLSQLISEKKAQHVTALKSAGYNVGDMPSTAAGIKFDFRKKKDGAADTAIAAPGRKTQDKRVADYAAGYGLDYEHAREIMTRRGYEPQDE